MKNHKNEKHREKQINKEKVSVLLKCKECEFESETKESMKCHEKEKHKVSSPNSRKVIFKCEDCDYEADSSADMKNHKRSNHKTILYQCEECGKEVKDKQKLIDHKTKNHKDNRKSVKCNECDFTTDSKDTLSKHMQVAMGHKVNKICKYFQNGSCKFGTRCRYMHKTTKNRDYGTQRHALSHPKKQCKFYGRCTKFPSCGFAHDELCKFQDRCFKNKCQFVHLGGYFLDQWKRSQLTM